MARLWVRARAPFAAFRGMQAGAYRATVPVMPPSAAHGLVLNLAGVETRAARDGGAEVTTLQRADVPRLRIAVGSVGEAPEVCTLYQQLHGYPVGASGKALKDRTHGSKYWIAPARREVLVGLDVVIGVETDDDVMLDRVRRGAVGELDAPRYGLPFAGDNNFLFDRIDVHDVPPSVRWYAPVEPGATPRRGSCRLTVGIDRAESSRTTSLLMAPLGDATTEPPEAAWVWTPHPPDPPGVPAGTP